MARLAGIKLLLIFFAFGEVASALTMVLLLFPGTGLDSIWRLNRKRATNIHRDGPVGSVADAHRSRWVLGAHLRRLVLGVERAGVEGWRL